MTKSHLASQFYVCKRVILRGSVGERLLSRVSACSQGSRGGGYLRHRAFYHIKLTSGDPGEVRASYADETGPFDEMDSVNLARAEHAGEAWCEAVFTYHF